MSKELIMFTNGVQVRTDKDGNICLTDLWKSAGENVQATPAKWQETESAKSFIKATAQILNIAKNDIIKSKRGKGGGTYAHKQIALEYAQYLDPNLAVAVNQVFFERLEEEKNPELAVNRAMKTWERQGKDERWIGERLSTIAARKNFTATLASHGVKGIGFKDCTNAIYNPMFGMGGADRIREKKGLPAKANTRDHMSEVELAAIRLAELLAADNITRKGLQGNKACEYECLDTSRSIARAISTNKKHQLQAA